MSCSRLRAVLFAASVLFLAACSGLSSEPRIVASIPPPTAAPAEVGFPLSPPDIARGALLFAENCTDCHGPRGAGDGPLVQTGQVGNAGNFTTADAAWVQRPVEWFNTITQGRIENLMPPWQSALTEAERWDVAYFTYTLHYTPAQMEQGASLYARHCAECHGDTGAGDGERAAELSGSVPSLLDQEELSLVSDRVIYNIVTEGVGDPRDGMPGFQDEMTEAERLAVTAYTRTLSFANPQAVGLPSAAEVEPASTAEVTEIAERFALQGSLVQGTAGARLPADQSVSLFIFHAEGSPTQLDAIADADGQFVFSDVPLEVDAIYSVTTAYRDRIFGGDFIPGTEIVDAVPVVTLFELTEDPTVISINAIVTQVNATADGLEIAQVLQFSNQSDRAYTTSQQTPDGRPVGLVISLPPGAVVPGFSEPGRYVVAQEQFAVIDTAVVLPGESHLVQLVYLLAYSGSAVIEQPLNYPLQGNLRLLVRPTTLQVEGDLFPRLGEQTLGESAYMSYGSVASLQGGDVLRFELTGSGGASTVASDTVPIVSSTSLPLILVIGIIAEVLLVAALIYWYTRRRRRSSAAGDEPATKAALMDALVRQIAELDAEHERGEIDDEAWQRQRTALRNRLAELLQDDGAD